MKTVHVLGASGAMGRYVVPELAKVPLGYEWQGYEGEGRRMDAWLEGNGR